MTSVLLTVALFGIEAMTIASFACGVPGTLASTEPASESSGIFLKSSGSDVLDAVHGPARAAALNHRPAASR